jgi:NAD+ kinase
MKFGIFSNTTRDIDGKASIALAKLLIDKSIDFAFCQELAITKMNCEYLSNEELAEKCDVIVLFGGDGTVLHYAKLCARFKTPIFAVNAGRVGFLTESENIDLNDSIERIIKADYIIENRKILEVTSNNETYLALNEVIVSRGSKVTLIDLSYKVDNFLVENLRSDALIVATPTGSTAYSLSSGGPIISPDVKGIVITPVCPYSLHSRPLVVNDASTIEIDVSKVYNAHLSIDGEQVMGLITGDKVFIKKSLEKVSFIRFDKGSFYNKLQRKLNITE